MNKRILALLILLLMIFTVGCKKASITDDTPSDENIENEGGREKDGTTVEEKNERGEFFYQGKVTSVDNLKYIEIEIINSDVAFGTYWVLIGEQTEFFDNNGNQISREDIKVDDIIEVIFSGQVMMSYPPQIAAQQIYKI